MKINRVVLIAAQLVFPTLAFAYDRQYGMWPGMMGGYSMGWPMIFFMLLFWGAVLAGIIALLRLVFSKGGHDVAPAAETALDILKKRYAKGEISQEEFEEKKRKIEG